MKKFIITPETILMAQFMGIEWKPFTANSTVYSAISAGLPWKTKEDCQLFCTAHNIANKIPIENSYIPMLCQPGSGLLFEPQFDTSWNLLNAVVDRIESIGYYTIMRGTAGSHLCNIMRAATNDKGIARMEPIRGLEPLLETLYRTKIEAVYQACLLFIQKA
jgi:hypothetical protein